jgi:hypothetical protein
MIRRLLIAGFAAAVIAGCGSGSASPSVEPSDSAPATAEPAAEPTAAVEQPTTAASEGPGAEGTSQVSKCAAVAVRKAPKAKGALVVRIAKGTEVHVVATVNGEKYNAGSCGTSGKKWLKIDEIDGKSVKSTYGVSFAYSAAGFFE